jgi:hypothetical protein
MLKRLLILAGLLAALVGITAARAGTLDGLEGILEGNIVWSLEAVGSEQEPLTALAAFDRDQWGLRGTNGAELTGTYAGDPADAQLSLIPAGTQLVRDAFTAKVRGIAGAIPFQVIDGPVEARAVSSADFGRVDMDLVFHYTVVSAVTAPLAGSATIHLSGTTVGGPAAGGRVYVNDVAISPRKLAKFERKFGLQVKPGRYWYDKRSGLWGLEGGPSLGQIPPRQKLGGKLKANASGGRIGVLFNGRKLHPVELAYLESIYGSIAPGRYIVNAAGVGRGPGGLRFNLGSGSTGSTGGGTGRSILGHSLTGSVIGDSSTVGFIDGATGVTCGPDGGCIY